MERANSLNLQMRNDAIAVNSLVCSSGDLIRVNAGGFGDLCSAGQRVDGIALNNTTFTSTNQTVAKQRIDMVIPDEKLASRQAPIEGGSITEANIGDFFEISGTQNVDFATASTSLGVVKLIKVLSPTVGEFVFTGQGS